MRPAAGPGLVTAFFTYTGPGQSKTDPHDEVSIEFLGKEPTKVQFNYYADGKGNHEEVVDLKADASAAVRSYAFDWRENSIRFFVDGHLVREIARQPGEPFPVHPGRIMLSLWSGAGDSMLNWLGEFRYPEQPLSAQYELISFTAAGDTCQFPQSVVCSEAFAQTRMATPGGE